VLRFLARQAQHLAQVGQKAAPVVGWPLRAPGVLAARGRERLGFDERSRQRIRARPVASQLAQVRTAGLVERFGVGLRQ